MALIVANGSWNCIDHNTGMIYHTPPGVELVDPEPQQPGGRA